MAQSFSLSNMVPQDPHNNEKVWSKVESDVRKYVRRAKGNVFVFTGPIFKGDVRKIGASRVWVPSQLFKLVYDEDDKRVWVYLLGNNADSRVTAPISYEKFVEATGFDFLKNAP